MSAGQKCSKKYPIQFKYSIQHYGHYDFTKVKWASFNYMKKSNPFTKLLPMTKNSSISKIIGDGINLEDRGSKWQRLCKTLPGGC